MTQPKESLTLQEWIIKLNLKVYNESLVNKNLTCYLLYKNELITVFDKHGFGLNYFEMVEEIASNQNKFFMPNEDIGSYDLKYSLVNN